MSELIFDKYEIIRRLAVGGMGEIFLARQRGVAGFDRLVILKSLLPDLAEQAGFIDQFLDEARVAATLNHPNIVSIYEVGAWQGVYFIAMEYINGDAVSQLTSGLAKQGQVLPVPVAARIIHDAALGLDHAHQATDPMGQPLNIIHRDVTPQNIMVRIDGVTKVVDFGVARAANRATRTATGVVKGKIPYMPPEQLIGTGELDQRADQWALGVVLWELLAGCRLFKAENDALIMNKILREPIPPPDSMAEAVPPQMSAVVMRMLERDRTKRFDRLRDVVDALHVYLDSVSQTSSQGAVADFMQRVAGAHIRERVADLTPSKPGNFVLKLKAPEADGPQTVTSGAVRKGRLPWLLAAGGPVIAIVGVALALWQPWKAPPPPPAGLASPPPGKVDVKPPEKVETTPPPAPATVLQLVSAPDGATVFLGDRVLGLTPLRLSTLEPDTDYQLVIDKPGFETSIVRLRLERGQTKDLSVTLKRKVARRPTTPTTTSTPNRPPPGPAATGEGFLTLNTSPWTKVAADGTPLGVTPLYRVKLSPGSHALELVNDAAGISVGRTVEIKPGEVTKLDLVLGK